MKSGIIQASPTLKLLFLVSSTIELPCHARRIEKNCDLYLCEYN